MTHLNLVECSMLHLFGFSLVGEMIPVLNSWYAIFWRQLSEDGLLWS